MSHPNSVSEDLLSEWWVRGLPAIVTAAVSLLAVCYMTFILPSRLPGYYSRLLEEFRQQYEDRAGLATPQELIHLGSSVAIAYSRVDTFAPDEQGWEEIEFYQRHVTNLARELQGTTDQPLREELSKNLDEFHSKLAKLANGLAALDSNFSRDANLLLAKAPTLMQGAMDLNLLIENLTNLLAETPADDELRLALAQLLVDRAWSTGGPVLPHEDDLAKSLEVIRAKPSQTDELQALELAIGAQVETVQTFQQSSKTLDSLVDKRLLNSRFRSATQACLVSGNWQQARMLLGHKFTIASDAEKNQLRVEIAESILRLFYSDLLQVEEWASGAAEGLQLALELNPNSRLSDEVLWKLAVDHAEGAPGESPATESVIVSPLPQKHLILAISSALQEKPEAALRYMEMARSLMPLAERRLAAVGLGRLVDERYAASLRPLLEARELSNSPELALAKAKLDFLAEDFEAMAMSLEEARKEFEATPLFAQLESALRNRRSRAQPEK